MSGPGREIDDHILERIQREQDARKEACEEATFMNVKVIGLEYRLKHVMEALEDLTNEHALICQQNGIELGQPWQKAQIILDAFAKPGE